MKLLESQLGQREFVRWLRPIVMHLPTSLLDVVIGAKVGLEVATFGELLFAMLLPLEPLGLQEKKGSLVLTGYRDEKYRIPQLGIVRQWPHR